MGSRSMRYTPVIAKKLCLKISEGKSLRTICKDRSLPTMSTIYKWLIDVPVFAEQYARAKRDQAEVLVEDLLNICDDNTDDHRTIIKNGVEVEIVDQDTIQRARLRVDTRKWIASKLLPKKYSDQLNILNLGDIQEQIKALTVAICSVAADYVPQDKYTDFVKAIDQKVSEFDQSQK